MLDNSEYKNWFKLIGPWHTLFGLKYIIGSRNISKSTFMDISSTLKNRFYKILNGLKRDLSECQDCQDWSTSIGLG